MKFGRLAQIKTPLQILNSSLEAFQQVNFPNSSHTDIKNHGIQRFPRAVSVGLPLVFRDSVTDTLQHTHFQIDANRAAIQELRQELAHLRQQQYAPRLKELSDEVKQLRESIQIKKNTAVDRKKKIKQMQDSLPKMKGLEF